MEKQVKPGTTQAEPLPEVVDAEWEPLTVDPEEARSRRRALLRRAAQRMWRVLFGLSWLALLGFADGMEQGGDFLPGAALMAGSLALMAVSGTKAGFIQW